MSRERMFPLPASICVWVYLCAANKLIVSIRFAQPLYIVGKQSKTRSIDSIWLRARPSSGGRSWLGGDWQGAKSGSQSAQWPIEYLVSWGQMCHTSGSHQREHDEPPQFPKKSSIDHVRVRLRVQGKVQSCWRRFRSIDNWTTAPLDWTPLCVWAAVQVEVRVSVSVSVWARVVVHLISRLKRHSFN